jgi:tRNA(His) guanylyltransferase
MSKKDYIGIALRMKTYEAINKTYLLPNMNNIIRLDGKEFHTYTKGFERPFDNDLIYAMDQAAIYLCSKIQGAKFGYVQSDEISICFTDYDNYESTLPFEGQVQKIVSVTASMCAAKFNQIRSLQIIDKLREADSDLLDGEFIKTALTINKLAEFDARVFQLPNKEEVVNAILWRQQDATRNSISSVAQSLFSHQQLFKKNTDQMQEMIFQRSGKNWNDLDAKLKRGRFIIKNTYVNGELQVDYNIRKQIEDLHKRVSGKTTELTSTTDVVRTKWESVEGPILSHNRNFLINLLPNNE